MSDDQSRFDLGAYGNQSCSTPNIDALADQGCRFERAYTPVSICRPSRACMYTGLYPQRNGALGITDVSSSTRVWPELMSAAGFFTGCIGKQVNDPSFHRFDFTSAPKEGLDGGRNPAAYGLRTREFLEASAGRPAALVVNFVDPHRGTGAMAGLEDKLVPAEIARRAANVWIPPHLPDTSAVREELAVYYLILGRLDAAVGEVLRAWKREALDDSTLVIFTSDNGADFPWAKTTPYEAGVNMPFIVRWPQVVAPGSTSEALISFVDLLPTVLEGATFDADVDFDGTSLIPLLRGDVTSIRNRVYGAQTGHALETSVFHRSIITRSWKYIRNFRTSVEFENRSMQTRSWTSIVEAARLDSRLAERVDRLRHRPTEELYDLSADRFELNDLSGDPEHAELLSGLREELRSWMLTQDDPVLSEW